MENGNGGARTTRAILDETLTELVERQGRLGAFVQEAKDVERAIKVIEKAIGTEKSQPAQRRSSGPSPRERFKERVLAALAESIDPLTREQLAEMLGTPNGPYLEKIMEGLVTNGRAVEVDGGYGLPTVPAAAME